MDALQALIIEDNHDICMFFDTVLRMEGFECDLAGSAKLALYRLAITQPDLILLDMRLRSEIGGDDILIQIRSNPRLEKAQVIVVTAYPEMVDPVSHLADLVLLKPVDMDQLRGLAGRIAGAGRRGAPHYFRDPDTDLYNRQFFITRLEQAVERSRRRSEFIFATLFFTFGAADADQPEPDPDTRRQLLPQLAQRLRHSYRPTDTLARWNGEGFATLHEELQHPDNVQVLIQRLQTEMAAPCRVGGSSYRIKPRFRAVIHSRQVDDAADILRAARQGGFGPGEDAPPAASA